MDFAVDTLGPCRKRVKVTVPPERVLEEYDRQYDEINDNVALPGFRKGRAPRKILEKRFGTTLGREVKEKLVQNALEKLVEDKQIEPLRPPEIDVEKLDARARAGLRVRVRGPHEARVRDARLQGARGRGPGAWR